MKHTLVIDGYMFRLRPVIYDDAQFIIEIRTENAERNKYIHNVSTDVSLQIQWLEKYFETPGDYYFLIEDKFSGHPEGLISIYNIIENKGESGRWVIKQDSLAAVESYYLLYRLAFEVLELEEVYCRVVEDNKPVVSFHKSVGQKIRSIIPKLFTLNDIEYNAIEFYMDRDYFLNDVKPKLEEKVYKFSQKFGYNKNDLIPPPPPPFS